MTIDLASIRARIPALERTIYLNTGWSGPSPRRVVDAIVDWLRWEADQGPTAPPVMLRSRDQVDDARLAIAGMCGADADEITLLENTTEGINIVINGIAWQPDDEVITCNIEHPSVLIPLYNLRDTKGVRLTFVDLDTQDDPDTIVNAFTAAFTPRTRLIALSHISFNTGVRQPLDRIIKAAHDAGIEVLADGAQTSGQIVLDMHGLAVDYYAFTGHKWMLGPDGAGAMFVRRDRIPELATTKLYMSATESFDTVGNWVRRLGNPAKFELTTTSPALLAGYLNAIALYQEIGPAAIEDRTRTLGLSLRDRLSWLPHVSIVSPADASTACGLVCFRIPGLANNDIVNTLWERRTIVCRSVGFPAPGIVRAACHYFNNDADLDAFAEEVAAITP